MIVLDLDCVLKVQTPFFSTTRWLVLYKQMFYQIILITKNTILYSLTIIQDLDVIYILTEIALPCFLTDLFNLTKQAFSNGEEKL